MRVLSQPANYKKTAPLDCKGAVILFMLFQLLVKAYYLPPLQGEAVYFRVQPFF